LYSEGTMGSQVKAVFFDVGNTLLFPNRERIHAPLRKRNITPDSNHLRALECRIKNEFDLLITEDDSQDRSFWRMYYTQMFADIGLKDDALCDDLVNSIRNSANWDQILPGTFDKLQQIARQFQVGVISNADGRIEDVLRRCEIAECFLSITDSGLVGYEKPHPEIFRQALGSLNVKPEESLYVGDMYSVDYLGATGAGMQAVLMDVSGAYAGRKVPRVESLAELTTMLTDGKAASP
jgi:HAD superfamily hydrolase (TIGR01509 family)